jgi:hypothetical protein
MRQRCCDVGQRGDVVQALQQQGRLRPVDGRHGIHFHLVSWSSVLVPMRRTTATAASAAAGATTGVVWRRSRGRVFPQHAKQSN